MRDHGCDVILKFDLTNKMRLLVQCQIPGRFLVSTDFFPFILKIEGLSNCIMTRGMKHEGNPL